MKHNLRIPLFITLIVASAGVGTLGVHASTDCQHLFRNYKDQLAKHLHHKVSAETLARWAAWNKAHPHYRPTRNEAMAKIDFVCQVPVDDDAMAQDLPPVELPPLVNSMAAVFNAPSQPVIVADNTPPDVPPQSAPGDPVYPPVYSPGPPTVIGSSTPPPVSITPEPASLVLMMTAFAFMSGVILWKRRQNITPEGRSILS